MWLPLAYPLLRTWPATQACALTGNRSGDPFIPRPTLNPLSYSSQGRRDFFLVKPLVSFSIHLNKVDNSQHSGKYIICCGLGPETLALLCHTIVGMWIVSLCILGWNSCHHMTVINGKACLSQMTLLLNLAFYLYLWVVGSEWQCMKVEPTL